MNDILEKVRGSMPLVHCITNPISINQCANAILAIGGRPIMAEHPKEVSEITSKSASLVLNLGNITDVRIEAMQISAQIAKDKNIPIILDLVGVGCSQLRRSFALTLLSNYPITVVKGNYSEIKAIYDSTYTSSGVDVEADLSKEQIVDIAKELANKHKTVALASGKYDIVTDGFRAVCVQNGAPELAQVTGTGCMLGAICGCFAAKEHGFDAAIAACVAMGICGERSVGAKGNTSFMINLLDELSVLKDIEKGALIYEE